MDGRLEALSRGTDERETGEKERCQRKADRDFLHGRFPLHLTQSTGSVTNVQHGCGQLADCAHRMARWVRSGNYPQCTRQSLIAIAKVVKATRRHEVRYSKRHARLGTLLSSVIGCPASAGGGR